MHSSSKNSTIVSHQNFILNRRPSKASVLSHFTTENTMFTCGQERNTNDATEEFNVKSCGKMVDAVVEV